MTNSTSRSSPTAISSSTMLRQASLTARKDSVSPPRRNRASASIDHVLAPCCRFRAVPFVELVRGVTTGRHPDGRLSSQGDDLRCLRLRKRAVPTPDPSADTTGTTPETSPGPRCERPANSPRWRNFGSRPSRARTGIATDAWGLIAALWPTASPDAARHPSTQVLPPPQAQSAGASTTYQPRRCDILAAEVAKTAFIPAHLL